MTLRRRKNKYRSGFEILERRNYLAADLFADAPGPLDVSALELVASSLVVQPLRGTPSIVDTASNEVFALADLHPGLADLPLQYFKGEPTIYRHSDDLYFVTNGGQQRVLWVTDGSVGGTMKLFETGGYVLFPEEVTVDGPVVLFQVESQFENVAIYSTQGTPESTQRISTTDSRPEWRPGARHAFVVEKDSGGFELLVADPSVADGVRILHRSSANSVGMSMLDVIGDDVYFSVLFEHASGTRYSDLFVVNRRTGEIENLVSPATNERAERWRSYDNFTQVGERLFFAARRGHSSLAMVSGGTADTTVKTKFSDSDRIEFFAIDDALVLVATRTELWALKDVETAPTLIWESEQHVFGWEAISLGSELLLDYGSQSALLQTDGTAEGTRQITVDTKLFGEPTNRFIPQDGRFVVFSSDSAQVIGEGVTPTKLPIPNARIDAVHPTPRGAVMIIESEALGDGPRYGVYTTDGTPDGTYLLDRFDSRHRPRPELSVSSNEAVYMASPFEQKSATVVRISLDSVADVNKDAKLNAEDIDSVFAAVVAERTDIHFDINADGAVTAEDAIALVENYAETKAGDLNLDRRVDFTDFLHLSANFGKSDAVGWGDGDFDGNGKVDLDDFLSLSRSFGYDGYGHTSR